MERNEIISVLNQLIEKCEDGEYGYHTASEYLESQQFKTLFQNYSLQRRQFIKELKTKTRLLGGDVQDHGSLKTYRTWTNIRTAAKSNDIRAVLEQCEHGENAALVSYEEALSKKLPDDIYDIIHE